MSGVDKNPEAVVVWPGSHSLDYVSVLYPIVLFGRKTKMQKRKDADGVERTIPCPHKVGKCFHTQSLIPSFSTAESNKIHPSLLSVN